MNPIYVRVFTLLVVLLPAIAVNWNGIVSAGPSPSVHLDLAAMVLRPSDFVATGIEQECSRELPATRSIPVMHNREPLGPTGGVIPDREALAASGAERIQFTHHAAAHRTDDSCKQRQFQGSAVFEYRDETTAAVGMAAMYNVWTDSTKLAETKVTQDIGDEAFYMEGSFRSADRARDDTRVMLVFRSGSIISVIAIASVSPATLPDQADIEKLALLQLGRIRSVLNGDLRVAESIASPLRQSHVNLLEPPKVPR